MFRLYGRIPFTPGAYPRPILASTTTATTTTTTTTTTTSTTTTTTTTTPVTTTPSRSAAYPPRLFSGNSGNRERSVVVQKAVDRGN
jgi:hypothetical protein